MGAIPVYAWRLAPDGLATRRQLRALGLRPGGQEVAAQIERPRRRREPLVAYLYRIDHARPVRPMTAGEAGRPRQGHDRPPHLPQLPHRRRVLHPARSRHVQHVRLPRQAAHRLTPTRWGPHKADNGGAPPRSFPQDRNPTKTPKGESNGTPNHWKRCC